MDLTAEQQQRLTAGQPIDVQIAGEDCVVITRSAYERSMGDDVDTSPWTTDEMDLLSSEAADLLVDDGLDEEDDG